MPKRLLQIFLNVGIGVISILFTLIILEIGIRFITPEPAEFNAVCSSALGWRGTPNYYRAGKKTDGYAHTIKYNRAGMHDTEHQLEKPPDTFRILMLGDSFLQASQVNEAETSHQVLEDLLNEGQTPQPFEVISTGVQAWGTGQQLTYYRNEGQFYEPDLVLLMFYLGNDIYDNLPVNALTTDNINCYATYFTRCKNQQLDTNLWYYAPGLDPVMGQCPFFYKGLTTAINKLYYASRSFQQVDSFLANRQADFFHRELPVLQLYVPVENQTFRKLYPEENATIRYGWQLTLDLVQQLAKEVEANGSRFAVVLIDPADIINAAAMSPDEREISYQNLPYLREATLENPLNEFSKALAGQDIRILNLQPVFIKGAEQGEAPLFFPHDEHWTVAGNRRAGETIYHWLIKNSLVSDTLN